MCRHCFGRHGWHHDWEGGRCAGYDLPLIPVEEEIKELEEYKQALEDRLVKVNNRLAALKR